MASSLFRVPAADTGAKTFPFSAPPVWFSRKSSSAEQQDRALRTQKTIKSSAHRMSSRRSAKAISGSIIQNSARWRDVWLFSARKVGPKV